MDGLLRNLTILLTVALIVNTTAFILVGKESGESGISGIESADETRTSLKPTQSHQTETVTTISQTSGESSSSSSGDESDSCSSCSSTSSTSISSTSLSSDSDSESQTEDQAQTDQTLTESESLLEKSQESQEQTEESGSDETQSDSEPGTGDACLDTYGLTEQTVIFYYSDNYYSDSMKPVVNKLESEGYDFYWWANLWDYTFNTCFGLTDVTGITPVFVCAGTKEKEVGVLSEAELRNFCEKCKK